jgi:methanethiol S-methyltransferase
MTASAPPPGWALPFAWCGALAFVASLSFFLYSYLVRFGRPVDGDGFGRALIFNVAIFTMFALHHSLFARAGVKAWMRRVVHPSIERSVYTWIASLLFIGVCWIWQFVPGIAYRLGPPASWFGYGAQVTGLLLMFQGSRRLDVLDLAGVRPVLRARSAAEPGHIPLQTTGVFGVVRHPLYLGWALFVLGAPTMTATRLVFAVVSTLYVAVAIPWEERGLLGEFGERYEHYTRQVRWRMIPGLY